MFPLPVAIRPLEEPVVENIQFIGNLYFRSVLLKEANTMIPQHDHAHDHATYIGSGKVRLWVNGKYQGDYEAGQAVEIKANQKHMFLSLEPNTRLTCVHDMNSAALIEDH